MGSHLFHGLAALVPDKSVPVPVRPVRAIARVVACSPSSWLVHCLLRQCADCEASGRQAWPHASTAQIVRASLFAAAATATPYGRYCNKAVIYGQVRPSLDRMTTARAPCISNVRRKTRYKGLTKNTAQLLSLFGLANLVIANRSLWDCYARGGF